MKAKNLFFYTLIICIIILIFLKPNYSKASIPQIDLGEVMLGLVMATENILTTKIWSKISDVQVISNFHRTIDSRMVHVTFLTPDIERRSPPDILQWNVEVNNRIFQIYVDRELKTITIRGEAENLQEKERVEYVIKLRAPTNFHFINEIEIYNDLS
jgi:hypothetical protein